MNSEIKNETNTYFNRDDFSWDGMYLMYEGRHSNSKNFEDVYESCHPSRVGMNVPEFVARWKYGRNKASQKNKMIKELCQSGITVEKFVKDRDERWARN